MGFEGWIKKKSEKREFRKGKRRIMRERSEREGERDRQEDGEG